ncbi:unnamed protein product [Lactuca virosa]|uniref:Uncharacterized protein n=1 Tax=Lactuca virosa TaxID=75947 RepID=A0AAU9PRW5_9ASTR|nr:unnamed protein product [Lactuca virosa]
MASSSKANNSLDILSEVKKLSLTKSIDHVYSCINMNAIKAMLDTSIQNREEKKRQIEETNLIHKDVVHKYLDDEINVGKKKISNLQAFGYCKVRVKICKRHHICKNLFEKETRSGGVLL